MNGESTSMVWPTLGTRTAKEQEQYARWPPPAASNPAVNSKTTLQTVDGEFGCWCSRANGDRQAPRVSSQVVLGGRGRRTAAATRR